MAVLSSVLGFLSKALSFILKFAPVFIAYFQGKKAAHTEQKEKALEDKQKVDNAVREVRDNLREEEVGDYIRRRDI